MINLTASRPEITNPIKPKIGIPLTKGGIPEWTRIADPKIKAARINEKDNRLVVVSISW